MPELDVELRECFLPLLGEVAPSLPALKTDGQVIMKPSFVG